MAATSPDAKAAPKPAAVKSAQNRRPSLVETVFDSEPWMKDVNPQMNKKRRKSSNEMEMPMVDDSPIESKESWVDRLPPTYKKLGLVAMLGSSFFFSIMALLVKVLHRFGTFELVFWRSFFMTIFSTSMCLKNGLNPLGPGLNAVGILSARGILGFFFMGCYYYAIKTLPLSDAVVITYLSPVFTSIAAFLVLGEAFGLLDICGTLLSMTGVILVSKPTFVMGLFGEHVAPLPVDGTLWALGAALTSTGVYLLLRFAKNLEPMVATNYFAMWGVVLGPAMGYAFGETIHFPTGLEFAFLILLALLSVAGQNLMNIGIAIESAGKAVAMNYTQVAWAFLWQIFLLHNTKGCDLQSILGAVMIASWGGVAVGKELLKKKAVARETTESNYVVLPA